ncbi:hypothetical protein GGI19_004247 [Coemansia pectinata]|uniref:Uncharacterized protein n=1 Tax=Coemansia pectinata TaxID=1052879 RepID=A0A9W8L8K8_9FUNG|nr:hypothetical protein GGI19_004247 [Coemansia pectinata]
MSDVDWFTYFLHPERLDADFGQQSNNVMQREAGVQVLRGLLGTSNFREYVISAYPTLRDAHGQPSSQKYSGPTPPSTPKSPNSGGAGSGDISHISRMGQCSRFSVSPVTGLPSDNLTAVLKLNELPELSARQERLLMVAKQLSLLVRFDVEEVETAVHATVRFMYYLNLLPDNVGDEGGNIPDDTRFQIHRWIVRSAYREEDIGLSMEVERSKAMDVSCRELSAYAAALTESDPQSEGLKFRVTYDLARLYLAQSRFTLALARFNECQRIDPTRCTRNKFGLAVGRPKPSVDEYATACATIVQPTEVGPRIATSTPTDQLRNMYISRPQSAPLVLVSATDYLRAMEHCLTAALEDVAKSTDTELAFMNMSWLACVHPPLLQYCAKLSADDVNTVRTRLRDVSDRWITASTAVGKVDSLQIDELKRQSDTIIDFITNSWLELSLSSGLAAGSATEEAQDGGNGVKRATIAEDQLKAMQTLDLDLTKAPLAIAQLSYCYLSGLRLLEQELYKDAQVWFAHGLKTLELSPESSQQLGGQLVMTQQIEKDKALRSALAAQVRVHEKLASLLYQIEQGTEVNDLSDDIDAILETQVPIRFEFLEHLVLICLRQDNKSVFTRLVATIATNQKLYQQLPEIHITLLQIASLLVVVRDALYDSGVDISRELSESRRDERGDLSSACRLLSGEALARLQKPVAEIATLLLKIPIDAKSTAAVNMRVTVGCVPKVGSRVENEIERFCRMWGDPAYLLLLGSLLSEMLQRSSGKTVCGPLAVCELVAHIVGKHDSAEDIAVDGEIGGGTEPVSSIVQDVLNGGSEQGRKNIAHMRDIAFIVFTGAARDSPSSACLWLYFSAVASGGKMAAQFLALFIEYLSLQTDAFAPKILDTCMGTAWFQAWLPEMIRALADLRMSGAAAVLHQCTTDISYEAAILLLVQAFDKGEISQRVAEFFWDPNIIEYGQYLGRQPSSTLRIEFPVPSAELIGSRSLILSSYFLWLSSIFSAK